MADQLDERGFPIAYINEQTKLLMEERGCQEWVARAIAEGGYEIDVQIIREMEAQVKAGMGCNCPSLERIEPPYDGSQRRRNYWKKVKFV